MVLLDKNDKGGDLFDCNQNTNLSCKIINFRKEFLMKNLILSNKKTPQDCWRNLNGVIRSDLLDPTSDKCIMPHPNEIFKCFVKKTKNFGRRSLLYGTMRNT